MHSIFDEFELSRQNWTDNRVLERLNKYPHRLMIGKMVTPFFLFAFDPTL